MDKLKEKHIKSESDKKKTKEKKKENQGAEATCCENQGGVRNRKDDEGDSTFEKHDREGKEILEITKEELAKLLEEKNEELRQTHDRLLRRQADYENYKKRVAREKADLLKFGNAALIKELLPIIDNLELSLEHTRNTCKSENINDIIEGIEIIRKEFLKKLEKVGLRVVSAQGEKFDPTKHEATTLIETSEYPESAIVEELQKGYFLHDRLLRPAKVTVARLPDHTENELPKSQG